MGGGIAPNLHQDRFGIVGIEVFEIRGDSHLGNAIPDIDVALPVFQIFNNIFDFLLFVGGVCWALQKGAMAISPASTKVMSFVFMADDG